MRKTLGFTLLELMIAMFIGILLLGGVIATYVGMKATTNDTMSIGELQEKGRLALSILRRDIEQVGFWGTFYDEGFTEDNQIAPNNPEMTALEASTMVASPIISQQILDQ